MPPTSPSSVLDPIISLVTASISLPHLRQIHSHLLTAGVLPRLLPSLLSSLLPHHLPYASTLHLHHHHHLLRRRPSSFLFSLNTLLRACSATHHPHLAFPLYRHLLSSTPHLPNRFTFTFLVRASAHLLSIPVASSVHAALLLRGFSRDPHITTALIHMYAQLGMLPSSQVLFSDHPHPDLVCTTAMLSACAACGDITSARYLFDGMPKTDPIAWNALIAGYSHAGRWTEALCLFHRMQKNRVAFDEGTLAPVLAACARVGARDFGRWVHACIRRRGIRVGVVLGTALVDMYSRCGDVGRAMGVFWAMGERNVRTWSSAIRGLAVNGEAEECLELFELMRREGFAPNAVTLVAVLHGCSVGGLVERGREYFARMRESYSVEPAAEHYGCMVDLYGRAGRLAEAVRVVESMPMVPHVGAWGALLHACRLHGARELGEHAQGKVVELEPRHDGARVLLSNIYAESSVWECVRKVRNLMEARGVRKAHACSAISTACTNYQIRDV